MRAMFEEIFLLKTVRQSNRALWWRSLLFHSGLFLVITSLAFGVLEVLRPLPLVAVLGSVFGYVGLYAMLTGAIALLWRRVSDRDLRDYTYGADIGHLVLISLAAGSLIAGALRPDAPSAVQMIQAVVLFDTRLYLPPLLAGGLFMCAALLAYIPFSRMAHFIGKYFAFHAVRWDDEPNRGGKVSVALAANLQFSPNWSAEHIGATGRKSWAEIAAENPTVPGASQ
ncbi:MAG: respiratory nitrate reductase subunit gamma [Acidobacteriaceae bacterium]